MLIGCTGETVIGGSEEIESGPALSLWSAILPGVRVEPFAVRFERTADGIVTSGLPAIANRRPRQSGPSSCSPIRPVRHPTRCLTISRRNRRECRCSAGWPAAGAGRAKTACSTIRTRVKHGAVGLVFRGGPRVRSVVSQGCRPIGKNYVVTRAEDNVIHALGGVPPMQRLRELFDTLSDRDAELVRLGLHLGLVMNEYKEIFERGDFLISNVVGADPGSGSIAVGTPVRVGQTVRFHVRDAETADEDLQSLLDADRSANAAPAQAALLFSCNGRGTRLFPERPPRRVRHSKNRRTDSAGRILRPGRARSDRRPQLSPRLHGQHRAF